MGLLAVVCAVSGCTKAPSAYELAEESIALGTEDVASRYAQLAFTPPASVTADSLASIAQCVFLEPPEYGTTPALPYGTTIYALDSKKEATSIRAFVIAAESMTSALSTSSSINYGCATLTAAHDTETVTITDESCPNWLAAWGGSDPDEVSLANVTREQTGTTTW